MKLQNVDLERKLKKIKLLLLDIDGVLTNGQIFWIEGSGWTRFFSVRDGHGIVECKKAGFPVGVLSSGQSKDVEERVRHLGLSPVLIGAADKEKTFDKFCLESGLAPEEIAFMGDEVFDLPVLKKVGFAATVADAHASVFNEVDWVSRFEGGSGAVRELTDWILRLRDKS